MPLLVRRVLDRSGSPLDREAIAYFEPRFGQDLTSVRLHRGDEAARAARAVRASAYTAGEHIVLGAGYVPGTAESRHLLAHELTHVLQHRQGSGPVETIARAPDPHQKDSSRALDLQHLHDILVQLLQSLKRSTQLSIMGYKTIALGLVEGIDENGVAFQTLVYTASGNWGSVDLESKAAALGIIRWNARARGEGRGEDGAPEDAEQLLIEGQDQADMVLLGMAVSRAACPDCAEALLADHVHNVFVDPAKYLAKRQRVRKVKASAGLEQARSELNQAFMPQAVAPADAAAAGLGPKSSLWPALNVLDIKELYTALSEVSAANIGAVERAAVKAEGVDNNRLLAPMDVLALKRENLKEQPEALKQSIVSNLIDARLAQLPADQKRFLLNQLYPILELAPPPKVPAPKKQEKKTEQPTQKAPVQKAPEEAEPKSSYVGPIAKALAALGVGAAAIEAAGDALALLASDVFTNVVLRIVAQRGLSVPVRQAIKEAVETGIKEAGPKLRVFSKEVLEKLPEKAAEELEHLIEEGTHSYLTPLPVP